MANINNYLRIIFSLAVILGLLVIYFKREKDENFLFLKLIGYNFLGSFQFILNKFPIPLGFLIYLFMFRPKVNQEPKKWAAYLGFIVFIVFSIAPVVSKSYFEWPREMPASSTDIDSIIFENEFYDIKEAFNIAENTKIEDFRLEFEKEGLIRELKYELTGYVDGDLVHYSVELLPEEKVYKVKAHKVKQWLQYNRLVEAKRFFKVLDTVNPYTLLIQKGYPLYVIRSDGEFTSYAIEETHKFLINGKKITELSNSNLPINGFYFTTYGTSKNLTKGVKGQDMGDFFFDIQSK